MNIPYITKEQMKNVDALAIESGISLISMMEKAGKALSEIVQLQNPSRVFVYFGAGHNGGGGLVAARYLMESGVRISLVQASSSLKEVTQIQLSKIDSVSLKATLNPQKGDIIIDSLLGYGIEGDPTGNYVELINEIKKAKQAGVKVVSLDLPSGLDATNGKAYSPHVEADITVTLALPKKGLENNQGVTGDVILVDIGIPNSVYKKIDISVADIFAEQENVDFEKALERKWFKYLK